MNEWNGKWTNEKGDRERERTIRELNEKNDNKEKQKRKNKKIIFHGRWHEYAQNTCTYVHRDRAESVSNEWHWMRKQVKDCKNANA